MKRIHLIARGVIIRDDRVLLVREVNDRYFFLPGGHIEYNESARDALRREMIEEIGTDCTIEEFVSAVEHRYYMDSETYHEVSLVFSCDSDSISFPEPPESLERRIEFEWIPIKALNNYSLLPGPMEAIVRKLNNGLKPQKWYSTLEESRREKAAKRE